MSKASQYAAMAKLIVVHGPTLRGGPSPSGRSEAQVARDAGRLARDLEEMGPTFVNWARSCRPGRICSPAPHLEALARLQDSVDPFPVDEATAIFHSEIGMEVRDAFDWFDPEPLAAASLGQVHRARLRDGLEVVVKIQRPRIEEEVADDLAALGEISRLIDAHTNAGRRYGFQDLLHQFEQALDDELDYSKEASNLERLAHAMADHPLIVVPCPVRALTTRRVITMNEIKGRKVTDLSALALLDFDGMALATALVDAYLDQIFVHGFFHADPHPGNVLITPDGRIGLIDVGMVGYVRPELRTELVKLLLAAEEGDGEQAGHILAGLGVKVHAFDEAELLRGIQKVANRVAMGLVIAALVLGAAILSRTWPTVALAFFLAAGAAGLVLIASIVSADRHVNSRARRSRRG